MSDSTPSNKPISSSASDVSTPSAEPALGRTVGAGMIWMMLNTVVGRAASLVAQIALAFLLTKEEFGVAALAIAFSFFARAFRDGGCRGLLIQRGKAEYDTLSGPIFWLALAFNVATCVLLWTLAPIAASMYDEPGIVNLVRVVGVFLPLSTPAIILKAKLTIDLRFRAIAQITASSAILRSALIIAFAAAGLGPISFVLPMPITTVFEGVLSWLATRDTPWWRPAHWRRWSGLLKTTAWLMVGTLATTAYNQGDFFALGFIVPIAVIGVYSFAYQFSKQVVVLLTTNLQVVLFPALARLNNEPERQRKAVLRTARLLMMIAAPASLLLASVFDPLQSLFWGERWVEAVPAVQLLCFFLPISIMNTIPRTVLVSTGQFRSWSVLLLLDAAGLTAAAALAGWTIKTPGGIALFEGLYTSASLLVIASISLRVVRISLLSLLREFTPALIMAWVSSITAHLVDVFIIGNAPPMIRTVAVAVIFLGLFTLLSRSLLASHMRELLGVLPLRIRQPLSALLHLRELPSPEIDDAASPDTCLAPFGDSDSVK